MFISRYNIQVLDEVGKDRAEYGRNLKTGAENRKQRESCGQSQKCKMHGTHFEHINEVIFEVLQKTFFKLHSFPLVKKHVTFKI